MRHYLIISTLILFAFNSDYKNKTKIDGKNNIKADTLLKYHSEANGFADIKLTILSDSTFLLDMRTIPQPETDDEPTLVNSTGIWTKNNNWTRLIFKTNIPMISALFDMNFADRCQFLIIDDRTVDINNQLDKISIWGVGCNQTD
jgi:hypothetical protein